MNTKKCKQCEEIKPLSEYYKHPETSDGHLNKCKECKKELAKQRWHEKKKDPEWRMKERNRHREKYYRLDYKEKHKQSPEDRYKSTKRYRENNKEKYKAVCAAQYIETPKGYEKHHWSYKKEHRRDVIFLKNKDHNKLHRFMEYSRDNYQYRNPDGEIMDTKEKHIELIEELNIHYSLPF